ncbi:MAG: OmpP1/FadL family transporter, partial [Sulfuricaulis sp.]
MTNNGFDSTTGLGVRLGALYDINQDVSVGLAYQSKIKGQFDKYKGLFAGQGEFDIPSTYTAGIAWKVSPVVQVAFDYEKIKYTDSSSVSNPIQNFTVNGKLFGTDAGPGFGWKDINVYKLGVQYVANDDWTLRAGLNHGDNPIPSDQTAVNILAPGIVTDHLNLGFTKTLDKSSDINFAFFHAFKKTESGTIPTAFGKGTSQISLEENYAEVGYSKKW